MSRTTKPLHKRGKLPRGIATLADLVAWYIKERLPQKNEQLDFYRDQPTLREAIRLGAGGIRGADGKMDRHQSHLGGKLCARAAAILMKFEPEIRRCRDFDELLELVTEKTRSVKGYGVLACYDAALRIGVRLRPELQPTKVYLHCGTREGAAVLRDVRGRDFLNKSELPPDLRDLTPDDIENFLCVCADALRRLK